MQIFFNLYFFQAFRECVYEEYFNAMLQLSDIIFQSFALALGKPIHWFRTMARQPLGQLRLIYYFKAPPTFDPDNVSCGEHTDHIGFTILAQEPGITGL